MRGSSEISGQRVCELQQGAHATAQRGASSDGYVIRDVHMLQAGSGGVHEGWRDQRAVGVRAAAVSTGCGRVRMQQRRAIERRQGTHPALRSSGAGCASNKGLGA
jgi:hypothetical protein